MKNSFRFFLIIVCLVLLCLVTGCQEENASDSTGQDTSEEENVRDSIGQDPFFQEAYDAFVAQEGSKSTQSDFPLSFLKMRVYYDWYIRDLIQGDSFEELLAADNVDEYYITRYNDRTGCLYSTFEFGGKWQYSYSRKIPVYWLEAFLENPSCFFEKSTNSAIPERVTVNSAYFLMGEYYYCPDHFVFYRTNKGNFVLFIDGYTEDDDVYLLPEDIFYDKIQESELYNTDIYSPDFSYGGPSYKITADFSDWKVDMQ